MADSEDEQIKQAVLDFLKTADITVVTERTVLNHVQGALQLSRPATEYKPLVSATIDEYLASLDDGDGDGGDAGHGGDDADDPDAAAAAPASAKRSRKRGGGGDGADEGTAVGAKKRRGGGGGEELLLSRDLSSKRKARVRRWEGKLYVDVREFYEVNGAEAPTQKGLSMDPGQWGRLASELPRLLAAQRGGQEGAAPVQLSQTRMAAVSAFKGTCYLGLREYYEKDGQLMPSKKGVNLNLAEAEALLAAAPEVSAAAGITLANPPDLPQPAPPQPQQQPRPAAAAAAVAASSAVQPPQVAHAAAAAAASGGGGGDAAAAAEVVELGAHKRVSLSRFGGKLSVDLREFYESNGQILPGKKGITLPPGDWSTLCSHLGQVSDALARKDTNYCLNLSGMRRVSLSSFKGVHYVGVREFYDKGGGEMVPGRKGLSMNPQQWAALAAGAPAITAALRQAGHQ